MGYERMLEQINSGELTYSRLWNRNVITKTDPCWKKSTLITSELGRDYHNQHFLKFENHASGSKLQGPIHGDQKRYHQCSLEGKRTKSGKKHFLRLVFFSHQISIKPGTNTDIDNKPLRAFMKEVFEELALLFKELGCDLILLGKMFHPERTPPSLAAGRLVAVPLWEGFSIGQDEEKIHAGYGDPRFSLDIFSTVSTRKLWK